MKKGQSETQGQKSADGGLPTMQQPRTPELSVSTAKTERGQLISVEGLQESSLGLQSFLRRKVWLLIFVHTAQSSVNMQTVTHSQHLHSVHRKPLATSSLTRTGLRHRVLNMALSKSIIHSLRTSSAVNHSRKASMTPHTHTHQNLRSID